MIIHGIEIEPKEIVCKKCGYTGLPGYIFLDSNKSIQIRCGKCNAWAGNYKYDNRSKDEIRKAQIAEWPKGKQA